jgi:hypothetical protein
MGLVKALFDTERRKGYSRVVVDQARLVDDAIADLTRTSAVHARAIVAHRLTFLVDDAGDLAIDLTLVAKLRGLFAAVNGRLF